MLFDQLMLDESIFAGVCCNPLNSSQLVQHRVGCCCILRSDNAQETQNYQQKACACSPSVLHSHRPCLRPGVNFPATSTGVSARRSALLNKGANNQVRQQMGIYDALLGSFQYRRELPAGGHRADASSRYVLVL
jgi:hypothetical protein